MGEDLAISGLETTGGKHPGQQTCPHCGMMHETTCPRIKAIEYNADGSVKRIEFHSYEMGRLATDGMVVGAMTEKRTPEQIAREIVAIAERERHNQGMGHFVYEAILPIVRSAVEAETERAARIADTFSNNDFVELENGEHHQINKRTAKSIATAIRSHSENPK